ncbi:hypothetical protein BH09MYX1_BH09MYX1_21830 [soil metagenome]
MQSARKIASLSSSAGKYDSIRSSDSATSSGVPRVVIVVKRLVTIDDAWVLASIDQPARVAALVGDFAAEGART